VHAFGVLVLLQCVAVCCSVLQCVAVLLQCGAVWCSVLQCAYDDTIDDDIDEGAGVCMCASIFAVLLQCIAGGTLCCCSVL